MPMVHDGHALSSHSKHVLAGHSNPRSRCSTRCCQAKRLCSQCPMWYWQPDPCKAGGMGYGTHSYWYFRVCAVNTRPRVMINTSNFKFSKSSSLVLAIRLCGCPFILSNHHRVCPLVLASYLPGWSLVLTNNLPSNPLVVISHFHRGTLVLSNHLPGCPLILHLAIFVYVHLS